MPIQDPLRYIRERKEATLEWNESHRLAPLLFLSFSFSLPVSNHFPVIRVTSNRVAKRKNQDLTRRRRLRLLFPLPPFGPLRIPTHKSTASFCELVIRYMTELDTLFLHSVYNPTSAVYISHPDGLSEMGVTIDSVCYSLQFGAHYLQIHLLSPVKKNILYG